MTDLLEIPDFLKRTDLTTRSVRRPKRKYVMPKLPFSRHPPKVKKFEGAKLVTLLLANQAPRIGSGYRGVWAKRGTNWAYLCDALGNRGKISAKEFDRLVV
jgi:hypothetical protein